jgi:tRNA nucleotidyltransferase/poly(A) polymerase
MDVRLNESRRHPVAPPAVRWITETLEGAGFETWVVGGAVRNVLLGIDSGDWDLATRAMPKQVRRLFKRTVPVGIEHGTVAVLARDRTAYEVTTFRRDIVTTGRHALVEFAESLEEDLARRDFTINAIAWHPLREQLFDPFGGVEDLEAKVLRTVGEPERRFAEDYLRVLRALRFAGRFGLQIEPRTWRALCLAVPRLDILSRERVREELMKVLAGDPRPSGALELYRSSGALRQVAPELTRGVGVALPAPVPAGNDAWRFGLAVAEAIPMHRPLLRLAALLLSGGNGGISASPAGGGPRARDGSASPVGAAAAAAQLLIRLRFSNAQVERVTGLVAAAPPPPAGSSGAALRRWLSRAGPERLPDLTRLWIARERVLCAHGTGDPEGLRALWSALRRELRAKPPLSLADLALDGGDLIRMGLRPGPRFRVILEALLERVLEDPSLNQTDVLAALAQVEATGAKPPDPSRTDEGA